MTKSVFEVTRGGKIYFRGDKINFRDDKINFRGDKIIFRGDKIHFRGDKINFEVTKLFTNFRWRDNLDPWRSRASFRFSAVGRAFVNFVVGGLGSPRARVGKFGAGGAGSCEGCKRGFKISSRGAAVLWMGRAPGEAQEGVGGALGERQGIAASLCLRASEPILGPRSHLARFRGQRRGYLRAPCSPRRVFVASGWAGARPGAIWEPSP